MFLYYLINLNILQRSRKAKKKNVYFFIRKSIYVYNIAPSFPFAYACKTKYIQFTDGLYGTYISYMPTTKKKTRKKIKIKKKLKKKAA